MQSFSLRQLSLICVLRFKFLRIDTSTHQRTCVVLMSEMCTICCGEVESLPYLKWLTSILFREFKILFPEETIIPKYHYVTHYSDLIAEIGPLSNFWVMRFKGEA